MDRRDNQIHKLKKVFRSEMTVTLLLLLDPQVIGYKAHRFPDLKMFYSSGSQTVSLYICSFLNSQRIKQLY